MRIGQTSAIFFASKFAGSIVGFVSTVVFARILGEAVLGQYATVLALVTWLTLYGKIGISESITKRLSEGDEVEEYMGAGLLIMGSLAVLVAAGVILFRGWVNAYIGSSVAVIIAVIIIAGLLNAFGGAALHGRHLVHVSSVLSTLSQFVRSLFQISLLLLGFKLPAMLAVYALSWFIPGVASFRFINARPRLPSRRHFTSLFQFAKFSWLGNVQSRVFNTLDILLLKAFVASSFVGIYSAAWSIGLVLDIFGNAIRATMFPEISKVSSANDQDTVESLTEDALTFTGLLLIPGVVGGLIVGDRLLRIYGEGFAIGTEVLGILLFALLVYTYTKQLLNTLNAVDRPDLAFRANLLLIGSNVVLNIILITQYGWVGAAVATLLSGIVGIATAARYVHKLLDVSIPFGEIGRQWTAALVMGAVVYLFRTVTEVHPLTRFNTVYVIVLVGVGAVVYFLTMYGISMRFRRAVVENSPVDWLGS